MRLLLIRHGQTPSNVSGVLDTRIPGPGLTALGQAQADAVPQTLAGVHIDAIFASVQVRSQITAAPLAADRGLDVYVREGIREISSGDYEMRSDRSCVEEYLDTMVLWADGDLDARLPGGESGASMLARFDEVVAEAFDAGHSSVALVSHGAAIRTWSASRSGNLSAQFIRENPLHNTGIVILEGTPSTGWTALTYMGKAVGGAGVDDAAAGPAAETL
jgi:broad specificity phosphatase PhoE